MALYLLFREQDYAEDFEKIRTLRQNTLFLGEARQNIVPVKG
jgi:hypothetical protein